MSNPVEPRSPDGREKFGAEELGIVLSNYDIGIVDSIVEFPRGSRKAPKLVIVAEHGKYLMKRRARGRDDAFKVAFCHQIQLFLMAKQFPLPHLIGTKRDNNSLLQWRGAIYELFEYIPGQGYPQSMEATGDSGRILALYHKLLETFQSTYQPPTGSYHMAPSVEASMRQIPKTLARVPNMQDVCTFLLQSYNHAASTVDRIGMDAWPKQIVHGDWHPGNMLFRENRVVAVIDYDSARLLPRVLDIANGALQFSILGGDDDVTKWPDNVDEGRFKRFMKGYDEVVLLSEAELQTVPWLMVEALIAEAVFPIAATGQFARMDGALFLNMVVRKVAWIQQNAQRLIELCAH
ncbi:MAG: phosphotransferase [Burkholderiales bacterium]|nr:phosphotransferase [Phycisphaerae bacterium]